MNVVHLTDSPFFGGPERQMLGLAIGLSDSIRTTILCFREDPACLPFLEELNRAGVSARMLPRADPQFIQIVGDIGAELARERADVLVCHGYKADTLGWLAARRAGVPVVSVSRGWTAHMFRVRVFEAIDRRMLRHMDAVVCVSEGQAAKVRAAGVRPSLVHVIHNAIDTTRFRDGDSRGRELLQGLFPERRDLIVVGVGRLSPEKGFDQLIEAAGLMIPESTTTGFVLIGDGPDRRMLEARVRSMGLQRHVVFAGFRSDVDDLLPAADVLAQSSYTEGLPNVVLEACAARVPVVATDVGGTAEVVQHGHNGYLVPAGDPKALAARLLELLRSPAQRVAMGEHGREIVRRDFSFERQSARYTQLFEAVRNQRMGDVAPSTHAGTFDAGQVVAEAASPATLYQTLSSRSASRLQS